MSKYFERIGVIEYDVLLNHKPRIIKNIMQKIGIHDKIKNTREVFIDYQVDEGETPEILSHKIYGDVNYHWVILLMNDIVNPYYDWVMTEDEVRKLTKKRYESGYDGLHHYVNDDGLVVDEWNIEAIPVTNLEYEISENEKKRTIKILDPVYLTVVESEIRKLFRS